MGMEGPKGIAGEHQFLHGAHFDRVMKLYAFDRSLRLLVMDAVEQVEVSVRTQWAYHLSMAHGAHAYLDPAIFRRIDTHRRCLMALSEEIDRSQETFVDHYRKTYTDPALPPIWAVCEVMSFGQLSRWVSNLKLRKDRQRIAEIYDLDESVFCSFLHHLTHVRNLCAHHGRLWNRRFTITMQIPSIRPIRACAWFNPPADRQVYNTLVMLGALLEVIEPGTTWPSRVRILVEGSQNIEPIAMGFPGNWGSYPFWAL
jgi:abortive infection bacteriophage resistance protein